MERLAIFKARHTGETQPWTALPVIFDSVEPVDADQAHALAVAHLVHYDNVQEVRWHWQGSTQGHYVNRDMASVADALHQLRVTREVRAWQQAARAAVNALESFFLQLEGWQAPARVTEDEFRAALHALAAEGLEGWFDYSPLNIDKLHGLLVEGAWEPRPHPLRADLAQAIADEDDEIIAAQEEDWAMAHL